ncbi:MAG: hypothetical protein AABY79_05310 [Nitrospirota bacterium]|jgi:hypothetical protein
MRERNKEIARRRRRRGKRLKERSKSLRLAKAAEKSVKKTVK